MPGVAVSKICPYGVTLLSAGFAAGRGMSAASQCSASSASKVAIRMKARLPMRNAIRPLLPVLARRCVSS